MSLLKNFTVLYVEDNLVMQKFMETALRNEVKELYIANNGEEGIELYANLNPDIIISDISMPKMDGLQMCEQIKSIAKNQAIVLVTGFDSLEILKQAIDLNINKFISKPIIDLKQFFEVLENIAQELQNKIDAQELVELHKEKERVDLTLDIITHISHHWKQPLSVISALASTYVYNNKGQEQYEREVGMSKTIIEKTKELSGMIQKIERLNFRNSSLEEIEDIIYVSDPIYKNIERK